MLYQHDTKNCFADAIGDSGLNEESFALVLNETGAALDVIAQAYRDNSLPLLRLPEASEDIIALKPIAEKFRRDFDHVVVLGTGGSSLGGQTLCALADIGFGPRESSPTIHFLDNIDPDTFEALFRQVSVERTGFIVISKSGGTAETVAQFIVCLEALVENVGEGASAKQILMITEPGTNPMRQMAEKLGMAILDHDPGIGGRFSVLSVVGLLPAMIAGLDPLAVRAGANTVLQSALSAKSPKECETAVGAAISISLFRESGATSTVLMPYADRLANFGLWFQQLWGESLGKDGTGTTPIPALGARDQHSLLQLFLDGPMDKMFTLLTLDVAGSGRPVSSAVSNDPSLDYLTGRTMGDLFAAEQDATAVTLAENGCPTRIIRLAELNEESLGALLMHFMLETIIAAHLLGVDPFDQPAVEAGKVLARRYLSEMGSPG
jgi:glucose-6-phosphate isomerase